MTFHSKKMQSNYSSGLRSNRLLSNRALQCEADESVGLVGQKPALDI